MAKRGSKTMSNTALADLPVYEVDFPESARGGGRAATPSVYEDLFKDSHISGKARAIVYDGTDKQSKEESKDSPNQYTQIVRELEKAKRHLDLGMKGPVRTELSDGTVALVFQATDKRNYNRGNGSEEASES